MTEMVFTPGTIVVIAVLAVWAFFAVRRLAAKGSCECDSATCGKSCCGCSSVDKMLADVDSALKRAD